MLTSKHVYNFPVPQSSITQIVKDNNSHKGQYEGAVDFAVPLGTSTLAAADGVVIRVMVDSNRYGEDVSFGKDVNYVTIEHSNKELSEYLHIAQNSALVKVGDKVHEGQPIAKTGLSGWLYAPHLHFQVYSKVDNPEDFNCLEIRFKDTLPAAS